MKSCNGDINTAPPDLQISFIKANLELELQTFLSAKIDERKSTAEECMKALDEIFAKHYPIFTRRWDMLDYKQGELPWLSWFAKKDLMRKEANYNAMSLEDVWVINLIATTSNKALRNKFLRVFHKFTELSFLDIFSTPSF